MVNPTAVGKHPAAPMGAGVIAGLNIYSHAPGAFDEHARAIGLVLATHGGLLMNASLADDRARNLKLALESNREIGVAIGVLMHEHRLSREQAFDVLRAASQDSNRKLADIALEVGDTGTLNIRGWPARPRTDSRTAGSTLIAPIVRGVRVSGQLLVA